jgi:hypothetical protein
MISGQSGAVRPLEQVEDFGSLAALAGALCLLPGFSRFGALLYAERARARTECALAGCGKRPILNGICNPHYAESIAEAI